MDLKDLGNIFIDNDEIKINNQKDEGITTADVDNIISSLNLKEQGGIIQVNVAGDVLFDFDSSALSNNGKKKLDQVANLIINKAQGNVLIIGHTDSKGNDSYNNELSSLRAKTVKQWLSQAHNLPKESMMTEAAGARYPIAQNRMPDGSDNPSGRAKNRRVEIQIATQKGIQLGAGVVKIGNLQISKPEIKDDSGTCISLCEYTAGKHS